MDLTPPAPAHLPPPPPSPSPADAPSASRPLFWRRAAAALLDGVIVTVPVYAVATFGLFTFVGGVVDGRSGSFMTAVVAATFAASLALPFAYHAVSLGLFATTPGKAAAGVDVRRSADGGRPGWGQALGRTLLLSALGPFALIGLAHGTRDGYHDLAAGTEVVQRPGRGPAR